MTNTFRSTNAGSSLQTNFGSIPYNNTTAGRLTEDKFSAANSRIGFRVDAKVRNMNVLGYYEGDFVGGVTGNNTQVSSNSLSVPHPALLAQRSEREIRDVGRPVLEYVDAESQADFPDTRRPLLLPGRRCELHERVDLGPHSRYSVPLSSQLESYDGRFGGERRAIFWRIGRRRHTDSANSAWRLRWPANSIRMWPTASRLRTSIRTLFRKIAFDLNSRVHFEVAGVESTVKLFNPLTQQTFTKGGGGGSINANFEVVKGLRLVTNN